MSEHACEFLSLCLQLTLVAEIPCTLIHEVVSTTLHLLVYHHHAT